MPENNDNSRPEVDREFNEAELDKVSGGQNNLDSMSEMGEMESMRMQMVLEKKTKFDQTLSTVLQKTSQTSSDITENLK